MPKTAKKSDSVSSLYDNIFMKLVPRIVDTNPELFRDRRKYWSYSEQQVKTFLESLPENYRGEVSEERFRGKAAIFQCHGSPYGLMMGFSPGYKLLDHPTPKKGKATLIDVNDGRLTYCPIFDLAFKPTEEEGARRIVQAGLEQFFLYQEDDTVGTLAAFGHKNKRVVHRDLELLAKFLPRGTTIEARCDALIGNGMATYHL